MRSLSSLLFLVVAACGTPAQQVGIGDECGGDDDCGQDQQCLAFAGGYCGLEDCDDDGDCPEGSACVEHTDGQRYCFLLCRDKPECNARRSPEREANCSANVTFVDAQAEGVKACVPPSGA